MENISAETSMKIKIKRRGQREVPFDLKQLGLRIDRQIYEDFKEEAMRQRTSIALLMENVLEDFLAMSYGKGSGSKKGGGKGGGGGKK